MSGGPLRHLEQELLVLEAHGRLRERPIAGRPRYEGLNLCSNDYLGYLATGRLSAALSEAAASGVGLGAGGSRLVSGEQPEHRRLEAALAAWLGCEDVLLFTSGYAANVGMVSAVAGAGDHIVSDALNHASIIDGCRLSKAHVSIVPHLDVAAVRGALQQHRGRQQWVVTESYFSMDADFAELAELRRACDEVGAALVVDEAHAVGVYGPRGTGRAAHEQVRPDVYVGTLGKAFAGQGAFVAGSRSLCAWLWNRARSFVFSTGLSPLLCAVGSTAVGMVAGDDGGRIGLLRNATIMRAALRESGLEPLGHGPIIPVVLGSEARALAWSRALADRGVLVQAIRPPTVPSGSARLRVTARADLTRADLARAAQAFAEVARQVG